MVFLWARGLVLPFVFVTGVAAAVMATAVMVTAP